MALFKIEDFNPHYREQAFGGEDIKGLDVYAGKTEEKIGTIHDVLVDDAGRFRYFVIDTGFWVFGKKVLLPMGRCRVDVNARRIYAIGLASKDQAERLPEYDERMTVDYDYEERVRHVYRTPAVEAQLPVEAPLEAPVVRQVPAQPVRPRTTVNQSHPAPSDYTYEPVPSSSQARSASYDHKTYTYEQDPSLYQMNDQDHSHLRLYEERLVVNKGRRQTGEVAIGKRVETETARASVPVERERVVIERIPLQDRGTIVTPGNADFREGEVAHLQVYEETADISKQAFVREEVNIRKEVERDIVDATETLRREELDVHTEGRPVVERSNQHPDRR
jgi:uncharacterized protein (TIGR02271 family)